MVSPVLLAHIGELYGLPLPKVLYRVEEGDIADNFVIEAKGEKYFLKKYKTFKEGEPRLRQIHAVKHFFSGRGIPVILPIAGKGHNTYFEFEKNHYALFPFIDGTQWSEEELSFSAIENFGKLLAQIHTVGKVEINMVTERSFAWSKEHRVAKMKEFLEKARRPPTAFDKLAEETLAIQITLAEKNERTYQDFGLASDHLIHGDYHVRNCFWESDKVKYVFDWEMANRAPRVMEVARALEFVSFTGDYSEENMGRAEAFLKGYFSCYPIREEEFLKGLHAWYIYQVHSIWIYEKHYEENATRTDKFLWNLYRFLTYYSQHLDQQSARLVQYLRTSKLII